MNPESVLVIGGGIVGLCTAYGLARSGVRVTLLDAGPVEQRASSATAGIIGGSSVIPWANDALWRRLPGMLMDRRKPLYASWPPPADLLHFIKSSYKGSRADAYRASAAGLANLGLRGRDAWQELLTELPEAAALFKQNGCMFFYTTEKDRQADVEDTVSRRSFGMDIKELSADDVHKRVPQLQSPVAGGACVTTAAHVTDPVRLQQLLESAIVELGGTCVSTHVTRLETHDNEITAVLAGTDQYNADVVVLAAGYGAAKLAKDVGLHIPMAPAWGASVTFENATIELNAPILVLGDGFAATPSDQGLRVSGLLQIGGAGKVKKMHARLVELARSLFGNFSCSGINAVAGARPLTADSLPVLGPDSRYRNLYHNFGHGHWGLTQASISAQVVCDLVIGNSAAVDISAYRPQRFQRKR